MVKRLVISREAYLHIDRIIEFNDLRNQSSTYSRKFVKALFKEFEKIKKLPFMGINTSRENIFLLVWNDYYIYYMLTETIVEIRAIHHQKENISR